METRANYAIIGLFTLAVIAAAFGFVYWFSGTESGVRKAAYRVEFAGSVAGLNKGASVLFNGIRVGDVTDVYFDRSRPQQAFARIEIQPDTPVKQDTKANLDVALLSGAAVIALTGGRTDAPDLAKAPDQDLPTIRAEAGGLGSLLETARGTAERASLLVDSLNGVVTDNREVIQKAIRDVAQFTDALGKNAPQIETALASIGSAATRIGPVAERLEVLTENANRVVAAIEPDRVRNVIANVDGVLATVAASRGEVTTILREASEGVRRLNGATPQVQEIVANVATASRSLGPAIEKLGPLADDAGRLVRAVDTARVGRIVENVDGVVATLSANRPQVDATLKNVAEFTGQMNTLAPKLDGIFAALSFVLDGIGPVGPKAASLLDETTARIRAVDAQQIRDIVAGANRFAASLDRTAPDVEQTLRNANSISGKLNQSADRIDGVLKAAENFLGSAAGKEGQSTFESIRLAADAFRAASDNLNRRATEIAQGVSRFSGVGSKQIEALGTDARRTVNTVGRAARNLEQNPSSVIFGGGGGGGIPQYSGR